MKTNQYFYVFLIILFIILFLSTTSYSLVKLYIDWDGDPTFPTLWGYSDPLPEFDASDLNASWTNNGTEESTLIFNITSMVKEDFYDFDLSVVDTIPASGNYLTVGVGSDEEGGLFGIAEDINNNSNDMEHARVWAGSFGNFSQFLNQNATVDRFTMAIAETLAHEAAHTYGCYHEDANPITGETCAVTDHIIATGSSGLTMEQRATLDRHFSTTSYKRLALNIGLKTKYLSNSDFINNNNIAANDFHIQFYSTDSGLGDPNRVSWLYSGSPFLDFDTESGGQVSFGSLPIIIQEMGGTWYEYTAKWSNPTSPIEPGESIHLGVAYSGNPETYIFNAYFTDNDTELTNRPFLVNINWNFVNNFFFFEIFNFNPFPVFISEMAFNLTPRLLPLDDLLYDYEWEYDQGWNNLCSTLVQGYGFGSFPLTHSLGQFGDCGRLEAGETRKVIIEDATQLLEEIEDRGPVYHSAGGPSDTAQGVSDPDDDIPILTPDYLDGLFPDTYVILQLEVIPYSSDLTYLDYNNVVHQVFEVSGVNPLGEPNISSVNPAQGNQGDTLDIVIEGSNFLVGANVEFSGIGITVEQVTITDSGTINAHIRIAEDAAATFRDIMVINPHTQVGVLENAFRIIGKIPPIWPEPKPYYPSYYYYSPPTYNYFNYSPVKNIGFPFSALPDSSSTQTSLSVSTNYPSWTNYYGYGLYGLYGSYYNWTYPYYYRYPWYIYPRSYTIKRYPSYSFSYSSSDTSSVIGNSPDVLNYTFGSNYSDVNISITNY